MIIYYTYSVISVILNTFVVKNNTNFACLYSMCSFLYTYLAITLVMSASSIDVPYVTNSKWLSIEKMASHTMIDGGPHTY